MASAPSGFGWASVTTALTHHSIEVGDVFLNADLATTPLLEHRRFRGRRHRLQRWLTHAEPPEAERVALVLSR
jgi:hypothetical protein